MNAYDPDYLLGRLLRIDGEPWRVLRIDPRPRGVIHLLKCADSLQLTMDRAQVYEAIAGSAITVE